MRRLGIKQIKDVPKDPLTLKLTWSRNDLAPVMNEGDKETIVVGFLLVPLIKWLVCIGNSSPGDVACVLKRRTLFNLLLTGLFVVDGCTL